MNDLLIAVTGGIGAGKSVVSRMLRCMDYPVYDTDSQAKELMNVSVEIRHKLLERFGPSVVTSYGIDRKALADIVFNDPEALAALNSIVHKAVIDDILKWREENKGKPVFVETALLYQSGLDRLVDYVLDVDAPLEVRIERVKTRDGHTAEHIQARIRSQIFTPEKPHPAICRIVNDGRQPVLPQVLDFLHKVCVIAK